MAKTDTEERPPAAAQAALESPGSDEADIEGRGLVGRIQRAWRETVGAYATDEGETKNLLRRLVDFGALSKDEAGRALHGMRERIDENRRELDRRVEESIRHAVARLTIPSPAEIKRLQERVAELEERIKQAEAEA